MVLHLAAVGSFVVRVGDFGAVCGVSARGAGAEAGAGSSTAGYSTARSITGICAAAGAASAFLLI